MPHLPNNPSKNGDPAVFLTPYITLSLLLTTARDRALTRVRREDGGLTLETAVIASALFLAAVALVAAIVRAISSRADQIQ